ncbi:hypothetical protein ACH3XW_0785 [Acanthocheilonema viteae]
MKSVLISSFTLLFAFLMFITLVLSADLRKRCIFPRYVSATVDAGVVVLRYNNIAIRIRLNHLALNHTLTNTTVARQANEQSVTFNVTLGANGNYSITEFERA